MQTSNLRILVTGAGGFIGGCILSRLASTYSNTHALDNFSEYYDVRLKRHHVFSLGLEDKITKIDICDLPALKKIYSEFCPEVVVHLAAQGGVRASQIDPEPYIQTNQMGFLNLLKLNNEYDVRKFIYASSSSVYGEGLPAPFREDMSLPSPKSLYAASKVANEIMAKHFYQPPGHSRIGLRFFTVYGPWGRPDMAVSRLLSSGYKNKPFVLSANLDLVRDFTFVEDVADVVEDLIKTETNGGKPHIILNVAGEAPRTMGELIKICRNTGLPLKIKNGEINSLDVSLTHGSTKILAQLGIRIPKTSLEIGIQKTAEWMSRVSNSGLIDFLD